MERGRVWGQAERRHHARPRGTPGRGQRTPGRGQRTPRSLLPPRGHLGCLTVSCETGQWRVGRGEAAWGACAGERFSLANAGSGAEVARVATGGVSAVGSTQEKSGADLGG